MLSSKALKVATYRRRFLLLVLLYLALLVATWVLTCCLARSPFSLTKLYTRPKYDVDRFGIQKLDAQQATKLSYVLAGFSFVAAVLALPVIYAVVARAAVVYALRTNEHRKLSARQLFLLADRSFIRGSLPPLGLSGNGGGGGTWFGFLAALLILVSFVHPIVRGTTVYSVWRRYPTPWGRVYSDGSVSSYQFKQNPDWPGIDGAVVAISPRLEAIRDLSGQRIVMGVRETLVASHPDEVRSQAWLAQDGHNNSSSSSPSSEQREEYHQYFATSLPRRNLTTGLFRQVALQMGTSLQCTTEFTYPSPCPGKEFPFRRGLDVREQDTDEPTYRDLGFDICVTSDDYDITRESPWKDGTKDRQIIREDLYIDSNVTTGPPSLVHCTATTTLAYFELGNDGNGQRFGRPIVRFGEYIETHGSVFIDENIGEIPPEYQHDDFPLEAPWSPAEDDPVAGGPLLITALALFGNGSFYDLAQRSKVLGDAYDDVLVSSCPYPFRRSRSQRCGRGTTADASTNSWMSNWSIYAALDLLQDIGRAAVHPDQWSVLQAALYVANKAVLDRALIPGSSSGYGRDEPHRIWATTDAHLLEVRQYDVSQPALVVGSVLVGLQTLGILLFLGYAYSVPTWTSTLDSLAIARIAHQLKDGSLLRDVGLRQMNGDEKKKLSEVNGLIGLKEPPTALEDLSHTTTTTTTARAADTSTATSSEGSTAACGARVSSSVTGTTTTRPDADANADASSQDRDPSRSPNDANDTNNNPFSTNPNDNDNGNGPGNSPVEQSSSTVRQNLELPSYTAIPTGSELRVGAQGVVTRRSMPRTRSDSWV